MESEKTKTNPPRETLLQFWNSVRRIVTDLDVEDSKLTEDHENRIRRHYNQLLSNLNVPDVVTQMFQRGKLTAKEHEHIRQFHSTPIRASEELLNIIITSSRDVYDCFLESLKNTKQHHVYQMLTSDDDCEQSVSEHSRLIRQNYAWLTETLDPDSGLLTSLVAKEVLSQREYGQIGFEKDRFLKNEILLSIISRKSAEDFKTFRNALNETSQEHITRRLTNTQVDYANQNVATGISKTLPTGCSESLGRRSSPKPSPKLRKESPTSHSTKPMVIKPKPLLKPKIHPCKPDGIEKRQIVTKHETVKKQSVLEAKFRKFPNELQTEVSTKICLIYQKKSTDSISKISFTKILQESRNIKRQNRAQANATDEYCEKLKEKTNKYRKQLRGLQETVYELEYRRYLTENENRNLLSKLENCEIEIDDLKVRTKQKEQEANEKVSIIDTLDGKVTYYEIKLKETEAELRDIKDQLTENDKALAQTATKLEETQEKYKKKETKLTEFEAKLMMTKKEVEENPLDRKQNLEKERNAWAEERKQLMKQTQQLQQELLGSREKCLDLEQKLELERTEKDRLKEQTQEYRRKIDKLQDKYKSDPVLVHTIRIKLGKKKILNILGFLVRSKSTEKEEELQILRMTILDKELFVVSAESSEVEVYDSMKFSFSRRWNLKELNCPLDIGSCNRNRCLYIFDFKEDQSGEILRVNPNGKLIWKWSTGDDLGLGMSVTDESNVIIPVYKKNQLNEYSPDGHLIREINLSSDADIRSPMHAIKLTNGHFVVSHGGDDDDLHRVCIVDADGNLKKSFGGRPRSTIAQMKVPVQLAVDGNGFVIVADVNNSRVLLLNTDLEFKRNILSKEKHGLGVPTSVLYDESNGRLFVADNKFEAERRILIFNVNK